VKSSLVENSDGSRRIRWLADSGSNLVKNSNSRSRGEITVPGGKMSEVTIGNSSAKQKSARLSNVSQIELIYIKSIMEITFINISLGKIT
jgi:hypothetical protein